MSNTNAQTEIANRERIREMISVIPTDQCLDLITDLVLNIPEAYQYLISDIRHDTVQRKLFVRGLSRDCTDQDLKEFFQQYGDVDDATAFRDPDSSTCKGYGTVLMSDVHGAISALYQPAKPFQSKVAHVYLAAAARRNNASNAALTPRYNGRPSGPRSTETGPNNNNRPVSHRWVPASQDHEQDPRRRPLKSPSESENRSRRPGPGPARSGGRTWT